MAGCEPPEPEPCPAPDQPRRLIDLVPEGDGACILDDYAQPPQGQRRRPLTHSGLRLFVAQRFPREAARCGLPCGTRVCVALPSGPESATALFAFTTWGCYAPLSVGHTTAELSAVLNDLQPSTLVVEAANTAAADAATALGIQVVELIPDDKTSGIFGLRLRAGSALAVADSEWLATAGRTAALLLQTSGTTTRSKTVALTHAGLCWGAHRVACTLNLAPSDICVNPMPLYHLHGIAVCVLASVSAGAAVVCPQGTVDGRRLLRCLREHRASWYSATPTHHLALLQTVQAEENLQKTAVDGSPCVPGLERLRFIRNCSAALTASLARRLRHTFRTAVVPSYAMTECLPIASHPVPLYSRDNMVTEADTCAAFEKALCPGAHAGSVDACPTRTSVEGCIAEARGCDNLLGSVGQVESDDDRLGSVGLPAGPEVKIMSVLEQAENGLPVDTAAVPVGQVGEVAVRGPCLMPGYVTNLQPTCDGSAPGNFGSANEYSGLTESGWLRTGDLGYFDAAGYLFLTGRLPPRSHPFGLAAAWPARVQWCPIGWDLHGACYLEQAESRRLSTEVLSPFVIEAAFSTHPSVADCVAFAVPHPALGETVGLLAVAAAGEQPVGLEVLRGFALMEGRLGSRSLPTVLVWAMPRELGLPAGRTGKTVRIGLAEKLGLSSEKAREMQSGVGDNESSSCWIGRRLEQRSQAAYADMVNGVEWTLEPWKGDQQTRPSAVEGDVKVECNRVSNDGAAAAMSLEQVVTMARTALYRCANATGRVPLLEATVVEAVRRLAMAAIGLDEASAASAAIVTPDSVLMDRGLDSMTAAGFVDELCYALFPSSPGKVQPQSDKCTLTTSRVNNTAVKKPAFWTTDILTQHATPRALATALCELVASAHAGGSKQDTDAPAPVEAGIEGSSEGVSTADLFQLESEASRRPVDEAQRLRAVAKSAARRAAKSAPRMSKAERRAAFTAGRKSAGSINGGASTKGGAQLVVENASVVGCGLYHAKHGDLAALCKLIEGTEENINGKDCGGSATQQSRKKRWDPATVRDRHGLTALQWAAGGGHLDVVEYLLQGGRGGDVDARSKDGRTALMWSCRNGALQVAQRLVNAGASPHAVSKKGVSCLHWAVWGQQPELAGWLLSPPHSLDLEGRSDAGCNAAVWAAASGGLAIAQWLHEKGADFTSVNHWGHGVVNKAAWRGHLQLLRWMFSTIPATVDQLFLRDYAGLVPVELATEAGHEETACYLQEIMVQHPQEFRPAITEDPVVHQHKLTELGLTDPNAL